MAESHLPWWLVLLLGVWVAGLSVWSWPRAQRQVRWGAGLLSLVYLVLLFVALGGDPRVGSTGGAVSRGWTAASWSLLASSAVALLAAVCLLGRPAPRGQLMWFVVLTLANAASCFVCGSAGVGWTLLCLAAVTGIVLACELRQGSRLLWSEWLPAPGHFAPQSAFTPVALVGATGFVLALLLVGTLGHVMRVETSRATASHRFSAIPSADRVRAALETDAVHPATSGPFELLFGRRADVLVLLAALAFLVLAMSQSARTVSGSIPLAPLGSGVGGEAQLFPSVPRQSPLTPDPALDHRSGGVRGEGDKREETSP